MDLLLLFFTVEISGEQLKKIILEQSVRLSVFHIAVAGLPYSGKTTLVKNLFNLAKLKDMPGLHLYESIIHRNLLDGSSMWCEGTKLQSEIHTILLALAHFFAKQHQLPDIASDSQHQHKKIPNVFSDTEVQSCFETTYQCVQNIMLEFGSGQVENALTGSLSLLNVFDVGVNKAVYEFSMAVGGRNRHFILINVLDLFNYDKSALRKPLNLKDERYKDRYSEMQASLYNDFDALHHFVSRIEAASLCRKKKTNTIIVGTHADECDSDLNEREKEIMELISEYCIDMSVPSATYKSEMVSVDISKVESYQKVRDTITELLDLNKHFTIDLPVSYIFLRYVLFSTKKIFMSRKEVTEYAKKCGITDENEIDSFLEIFRNCASIISSSEKTEFLYRYVILIPIDFLQGLNKLYSVPEDETFRSDLKEPTKCGIVSKQVVRSLWQGAYDSSMSNSDFYVSVLSNVGLLTVLDDDDCKYFVPSLRLKHCRKPASFGSLIINSNVSLTPFSGKQCQFVEHLTHHHKATIRLDEECSFYNSVVLYWKRNKEDQQEAKIIINFFHDFIEVSIDFLSIPKSLSSILYSFIKTECVAIMNKISQRKDSLQYKFAIVCPKSIQKSPHFVAFEVLETNVEELQCSKCSYLLSGENELQWVKTAYQGSQRSAIHSDSKYSACMPKWIAYIFFFL